MKEEETIDEYNTRVIDLSNEAAVLGKPIEEERMESKVLGSLPPRFAMKVIAIEEMHDITKLKQEIFGVSENTRDESASRCSTKRRQGNCTESRSD
ncbi:unnamed protein product [Rhodiola kirilowii]